MVNQVNYFGKTEAKPPNLEKWAKPEADFFINRANDLRPEIYKDIGIARIVNDTKELNLRLAKLFDKV